MQTLSWTDKGARCGERYLFSKALHQQWLQRSPAEENFHLKNTLGFFLIETFCENVPVWIFHRQVKMNYLGFSLVLIMLKCLGFISMMNKMFYSHLLILLHFLLTVNTPFKTVSNLLLSFSRYYLMSYLFFYMCCCVLTSKPSVCLF